MASATFFLNFGIPSTMPYLIFYYHICKKTSDVKDPQIVVVDNNKPEKEPFVQKQMPSETTNVSSSPPPYVAKSANSDPTTPSDEHTDAIDGSAKKDIELPLKNGS